MSMQTESQMQTRPNLLFIITDQQRWDAMGAAGNRHIHTPHLDRLCATGVRFTHGYAEMPECVPARAMIATGRWGHETGVMDNSDALSQDTVTFYKRLADSGYHTFAVGKMHINRKVDLGFHTHLDLNGMPSPNDDYYRSICSKGYGHVKEPHGIRHQFYYAPQVSQLPPELHGTVWVGDHAVNFIENYRDTAPWFAYVSFLKPHPPFDPSIPYLNCYDPDEMPLPARSAQDREEAFELLRWQTYFKWMEDAGDHTTRLIKASYYALVQEIDDQIGRILDALEAAGQRENTLILFLSDHGELLGDHYQWGKRFFYNGAMRVPYILSQPGTLPENVESSALVGHLDVEATMMSAAGLKPEGRGKDIRPLCFTAGKDGRSYRFGEFASGPKTLLLSWDGDWKYIYAPNGGRELLFHLESDPDELVNLAHHPDAESHKRRLREALAVFLASEPGGARWLDGGDLAAWPLTPIPLERYRKSGRRA